MPRRSIPAHRAAASAPNPPGSKPADAALHLAVPDSPALYSLALYSPALNAGFQAGTSQVQGVHHAIAGKAFDSVRRVPGLGMPSGLVQVIHDAITQGVYAAVRHGGGAALRLTGAAERLFGDTTRLPLGKESTLRSVLNGAVGDSFAEAGSGLAVSMGFFSGAGSPLALTHAALSGLRPRTCVFVHGLGCDEQSWGLFEPAWKGSAWAGLLAPDRRIDYGALLEHELGVSSVFLRYNTGLSIEANALQLATLLERLAVAAPQAGELVLLGHSMGGLVARRARDLAEAAGMSWPARASMLVCLGSPHQGAPLEQLGHAVAGALGWSSVTAPLGRIADARSQGIKDLRHGLAGSIEAPRAPATWALRLVAATLHDPADGAIGSIVGAWLGDGLVASASASDQGLGGDVQRVELAGLGHMALLNHPRVYAVVRAWLGAPALP